MQRETIKAAVLDSTENVNVIPSFILRLLALKKIETRYFRLSQLNILPCRSCGSCGVRTPGICVQKDDMNAVLHSMAESRLLVYITPVRFGGYSSLLKKAIDRSMPLGEPFYMVKKGHLLHPMRYGEKFLLGIGLSTDVIPDEEENFSLLLSRNAMNMQSLCQARIFHPADNMRSIEETLNKDLEGVL